MNCGEDASFDPSSEICHKVYSELRLGCETEKELKEIKKAPNVKPSQLMSFRLECKAMLVVVAFVQSVLRKSPLNHALVPALRCLDPQLIVDDKTTSGKRFKKCVYILVDLGRVEASDADMIVDEFEDFLKTAVISPSFVNFSKEKDRIDQLFYAAMSGEAKLKNAWKVVKTLLLLSHGQASVERGFSVNKECSEVNLSPASLIARRIIKDHIRCIGGLPNMTISKELLISARGAYQKYMNELEEKKIAAEKKKSNLKRKAAEEELSSIKKRLKQLESDRQYLTESADKTSLDAEKKANLSLLSKANCLRERAREKTAEANALRAELGEKEKLFNNSF